MKNRIFGELNTFQEDPIRAVESVTLNGDAVGSLRLGLQRFFFSGDPDVFQQVLIDEPDRFRRGTEVDSLRPIMGEGLVTESYRTWKVSRPILNQVFRPKNVNQGLGIATDRLLTEVARLASSGDSVDVHTFSGRATLLMAIQAIFGVTPSEEILDTLPAIVAEGQQRVSEKNASGLPLPMGIPTPTNRRLRHVGKAIYETVDLLRGQMKDTPMGHAVDEIERQLGKRAARDHIATFLVTGFETTATTAAWMLYTLANRPDLVASLREVCDHSQYPPHSLTKEPLVAGIVKEALRLYPSIWWFTRQTLEPVQIGDTVIPKNASLHLVPWALHRQPSLWNDPQTFDPDRWVSGQVPEHRWSWAPFGAGPRACIGRHLVFSELAILLWLVGTAFDMEALSGDVAKLRPRAGITLGSPKETALKVRMRPRTPQNGASKETKTTSGAIASSHSFDPLWQQLATAAETAYQTHGAQEAYFHIGVALEALSDAQQRVAGGLSKNTNQSIH